MKTDIVQKAIVQNPEGQILILRRSKTDQRRPNQWDLPGGLLEQDEDFLSGLEREITEESGLQVSDVALVFAKTEAQKWLGGEANVTRLYYSAVTAATEVRISSEHSESAWVTIVEAIALIDYPRHKEVLQHIIDNKLVL